MDETKTRENAGKRIIGRPFQVGNPGGPGVPRDTPEKKAEKKLIKEFVEEYRQRLAEALPEIHPVLIQKATGGNLGAIREINDRILGKPKDEDDTVRPLSITLTDDQLKRIAGGILDGYSGSAKISDSV